jgi:release factor glutamine methyltransferase
VSGTLTGTETPAEALRRATATIAAAGCPSPRLDAEILLADVLGVGRERLLTGRGLEIEPAAERTFEAAVARRARAREPVAYITGRRHFRHLELAVDPRALIPRPETELLVELATTLPPGSSVLDVGTGCGAVALAIKDERGDLRVSGSDFSAEALALARANGRRLGLEVAWIEADLLGGVGDEFDAIVANLPYVAEGEQATLAAEIIRHEPRGALFAGADGLATIRALLDAADPRSVARHRRARLLALEVGAGQAADVERMMLQAGFGAVRRLSDLAGIERVLVGERLS